MNEQEKALSSFRWFDEQRILFIATFLGGATGIIIARALGFGVLIAVLLAAAAMILYVLFGASKRFLLRPDILGDNTYYLGFLFTLVSLAYTLYKYSHSANEVDQIIQNFGIALSTTLIGLVARVYFNRSEDDPILYENAIRMSLAEQSAALIGETAKIRNDVSVLRTSIQQTVNEGLEQSLAEYRQKMSGIAVAYQEELTASAKGVAVVLKTTLSDFSDGARQLSGDLKKSSESYQSSIEGFSTTAQDLVRQLQGLASKISELSSINDSLHEKLVNPLNALTLTLTNVENNFSNITNATLSSAGAIKSLQAAVEGFKGLSIEHLTREQQLFIDRLKDTEASMTVVVNRFNSTLAILIASYEKMPGDIKRFDHAIEEGLSALARRTEESQRMILEVESSLVELANRLVDGVRQK
jgi:hypothetical protein